MTRPGRPSHPEILTPREQEVLALLREGLTNPRIAERLSITLDGAKYHVSEILSKLGVSSREEAARWQPSERPWWATAAVPLAWPWRRTNVSWLATAVAGATAVLLVAGVGLLVWGLVRTDGDADASVPAGATEAAGPTVPQTTPTPTAEPPTPQPTPAATALPPTLPPPATEVPSPTPDPACAARDHNHLNIDLLSADSGLVGAVISEIDEFSVRIEIEGAELVITGWGEDIGIGRRTSNISADLMERVVNAIDAANFVC